MIRVLHIVSKMHRGGIETMLMNYYRYINRNEVQFDFIEHGYEKNEYDDEIQDLGGFIYNIPAKSEGVSKSLQAITNIVATHHYDIVHVHMDAMNSFALYAAKKGGAKFRISHAHSTSMPPSGLKDFVFKLSIKSLPRYANLFYSCSLASSKYLYQNIKHQDEIKYVHNAILTEKFAYAPDIRMNKRNELNVDKRFVLGHVGNFQYPKNHIFLLEVLREYLKVDPTAYLILCGDGELRDKIEKKICELELEKNVKLVGVTDKVHQYMQAFDVLLHPSHYEGFPVVTVEGQCSGLPVLASDTITQEINLTNNVKFLPISNQNSAVIWSKALLNIKESYVRCDQSDLITEKGYNIKTEAIKLQDMYLKLAEEK